jgi:hypothetical protein
MIKRAGILIPAISEIPKELNRQMPDSDLVPERFDPDATIEAWLGSRQS